MTKGYIDYKSIEKIPNKYNLTPKDIKSFKVIDWDKLKTKCWFNKAMTRTGKWWCHLEGSQNPGERYMDDDEFWIGFNEDNNEVDYHFSAYEGMCKYEFDEFYSIKSIENKFDMNVQLNTMKFLNMLLDENIVELER